MNLSQQALADKVGVTRSYIGRIERVDANPSIAVIESLAEALGLELELFVRPPLILGDRRIRDLVHARCSGYVDRRLRGHRFETAREVEVVHGRARGWIDLLAFDPRTGMVLLIELKTRLDDLGAVERQIGWYERAAWSIARDLGWEPRRMRSWLLVLASAEIDDVVWAERTFFEAAFAIRARDMRLDLRGAMLPWISGRGLAMIDPSNRGRDWLIRTRADGRRSPARYANYADAVRRAAA